MLREIPGRLSDHRPVRHLFPGQESRLSPAGRTPGPPDREGAISLCVCTYNDHDLLDGLLVGLADWSRVPDEIVIVDDGSARPYALPAGLSARLIRLEDNSGPAVAKSTALSAARGQILLLIDADMRPDPSWLELALPRLSETVQGRPVGLIGCPAVDAAGDGLVGRYLAGFCGNVRPDGPADFLPGILWLMPAGLWQEVRGFAGFSGRTHEDHHFCELVRQAGYALLSTGPLARQVRLLSRTALAARFRAWTAPMRSDLREAVRRSGQPVRDMAAPLTMSLMAALPGFFDHNLKAGRRQFIYLELLIFTSLLHSIVRELDADLAASLAASLLKALEPYPTVAGLLAIDLTRLGLSWPENDPAPADQALWLDSLYFLPPLLKAGLFSELEAQAGLLDREKAHFSFYEP